jgi:uncharacterized membrane protein
MTINRITVKDIAKKNVTKHYGLIMPIVLFSVLVPGIISTYSDEYSFLPIIVFSPLPFGLATILIKLSSGKDSSFAELFKGYNYFWKLLFTLFIICLKVFIGLILLVIPGIIFALEYSMVWFILAENPELNTTDALNRSKKLMYGNKTELFFLILSFLGWIILSSFTAGLLILFYVGPYMYFTICEFYRVISCSNAEEIEFVANDEKHSEHGGVRE